MNSYENRSDEELIMALRAGDKEITDYLIDKYKNLVRKKANALYLIGGDTDDLIQEGMIGLFKAIRDYRGDRDSTFYHFAELCIARQMYTAVEASQRKKHVPLNTYVSLYADSADPEGMNLVDALGMIDEFDPEKIFINKENLEAFQKKVSEQLSSMEKEVLTYYLQGFDYIQIAKELGKEPKAIDNALQRMKKKLK